MHRLTERFFDAIAARRHRRRKVLAAAGALAVLASVHWWTVQSGDTLSGIAQAACGDAGGWQSLYAQNEQVVGGNPNLVYPGERLRFSCDPARISTALHATPQLVADVSSAAPGSFQACVIRRESGGDPRVVNPVSDAGGLYQFLPSTWASLGYAAAYPGGAQTAPVSVQDQAFEKLFSAAGESPWGPYDGCLR